VYQITNLTNGKKYIGKKFFYSAKTKQVKGKKKKYKSNSDWQTYYGSSDILKQDVLQLGHEKFVREIIHLCHSKGMCSYLEAKEQFTKGVLESDEYYNTWIMVRVRKNHIKEKDARLPTTIKREKY
jgi:antitoxin component YwqK of YwqJK toxin-antitoxin module